MAELRQAAVGDHYSVPVSKHNAIYPPLTGSFPATPPKEIVTAGFGLGANIYENPSIAEGGRPKQANNTELVPRHPDVPSVGRILPHDELSDGNGVAHHGSGGASSNSTPETQCVDDVYNIIGIADPPAWPLVSVHSKGRVGGVPRVAKQTPTSRRKGNGAGGAMGTSGPSQPFSTDIGLFPQGGARAVTSVARPISPPSMPFGQGSRYPRARMSRVNALSVPAPLPSITKPAEVVLRRIHDTVPVGKNVDDEFGFYIMQEGSRFADRFILVKQLGQGTFGKVVEAYDCQTGRRYAIKIIRAVQKYRDVSKTEVRVLTLLKQYHMAYRAHNGCIVMHDCFDYRDHICLVTDLLDISVYDFMKHNNYAPFPGDHIRSFALQLLKAVAFIHSLGLVHTDLKPENILLHCSRHTSKTYRRSRGAQRNRNVLECTDVTLVDFGSAVFDDEYHPTVVSTRHYRAPEIIFETGWSYECDMWSIGCLLVELCTGCVLFQTRSNIEHLHMMEQSLQTQFSPSFLRKAALRPPGPGLVQGSRLRPLVDAKQISVVEKLKTVPAQIKSSVPYSQNKPFWNDFLDLVLRLLALDPKERLTVGDALRHPWLVSSQE